MFVSFFVHPRRAAAQAAATHGALHGPLPVWIVSLSIAGRPRGGREISGPGRDRQASLATAGNCRCDARVEGRARGRLLGFLLGATRPAAEGDARRGDLDLEDPGVLRARRVEDVVGRSPAM